MYVLTYKTRQLSKNFRKGSRMMPPPGLQI